MKKPVVKKETIASLKAELWEVQTKYNKRRIPLYFEL